MCLQSDFKGGLGISAPAAGKATDIPAFISLMANFGGQHVNAYLILGRCRASRNLHISLGNQVLATLRDLWLGTLFDMVLNKYKFIV